MDLFYFFRSSAVSPSHSNLARYSLSELSTSTHFREFQCTNMVRLLSVMARIKSSQRQKLLLFLFWALLCRSLTFFEVRFQNAFREQITEMLSGCMRAACLSPLFPSWILLSHSTRILPLPGTFMYMAPEVIRSDKYDQRCDVYRCAHLHPVLDVSSFSIDVRRDR